MEIERKILIYDSIGKSNVVACIIISSIQLVLTSKNNLNKHSPREMGNIRQILTVQFRAYSKYLDKKANH